MTKRTPSDERPPPTTSLRRGWTRSRKAMSSRPAPPPRNSNSSTATTTLSPTARATPPRSTDPDTDAGLLTRLGPGVITGVSDDDPSGIATYTQVGTQFGFGLLW